MWWLWRSSCAPSCLAFVSDSMSASLAGHRQSTVKPRLFAVRQGRYLSMAVLEIRLLGELDAKFDGTAVVLPNSRRACALLGWLALRPGPHSRSRLARLL